MRLIIEASSDEGDVIWEPFGGLFSGALAARQTGRRAYASEIDPTYYQYAVRRFTACGALRTLNPRKTMASQSVTWADRETSRRGA